MNHNQVTVPALDIAATVDFYTRLGLELIVSSPHYARVKCPEGAGTFSVHFVEELPSHSNTGVYFETSSLSERVRQLQAEDLTFIYGPRDEPWLWREARIIDPPGNRICLYWGGENRLNPSWRIN